MVGSHSFVWMVLLASLVTAVVGYTLVKLFEKIVLPQFFPGENQEIEVLFKSLPLIGCSLLVVSFIILIASWFEETAFKPTVSPVSAMIIGFVQALCLPFRGLSRSGATISTGFYCGINRKLSEDFSFALAVVLTPAVIGRGVYKLYKEKMLASESVLGLALPGLVGMVFSFLAGMVALRLLGQVLERGGWKYFGYYCMVAAVVVFGVALAGW